MGSRIFKLSSFNWNKDVCQDNKNLQQNNKNQTPLTVHRTRIKTIWCDFLSNYSSVFICSFIYLFIYLFTTFNIQYLSTLTLKVSLKENTVDSQSQTTPL